MPVYGYSHILGLTTIVPTGAIESAALGKGGFDGSESNFTASHLRIISKTPDFAQRFSFSVNNFLGGAETNGGRPFHARFDRRHVVNATASWRGLSATFILQSGHWENGAAETYQMHIPGNTWEADYYAGVNNYHMPTVIRLDLGYQFEFKTGRVDHKVNLGVCNVTNHFNPFMLYFDPSTESWKEIALMPILPNFSWRIEF